MEHHSRWCTNHFVISQGSWMGIRNLLSYFTKQRCWKQLYSLVPVDDGIASADQSEENVKKGPARSMLNMYKMLYNFQKLFLQEVTSDITVSLSSGGALPGDKRQTQQSVIIIISVLTISKYVLGHSILFILIQYFLGQWFSVRHPQQIQDI